MSHAEILPVSYLADLVSYRPSCKRTHQPTLSCYLLEENFTVRDHTLHLGGTRNWQPPHFCLRDSKHQHGDLGMKHVDLIIKHVEHVS